MLITVDPAYPNSTVPRWVDFTARFHELQDVCVAATAVEVDEQTDAPVVLGNKATINGTTFTSAGLVTVNLTFVATGRCVLRVSVAGSTAPPNAYTDFVRILVVVRT